MTTTTTNSTVINRQDPAIEAYRLGLLGDVQGYISQQIASGDMPPDYQVAGLAPSEQAAIAAAKVWYWVLSALHKPRFRNH